jgi:hypothetical protein
VPDARDNTLIQRFLWLEEPKEINIWPELRVLISQSSDSISPALAITASNASGSSKVGLPFRPRIASITFKRAMARAQATKLVPDSKSSALRVMVRNNS